MAGWKEGAASLRKRNTTLPADPGYVKIYVNMDKQLYTVDEYGVSALVGGSGSGYYLSTSGTNLIVTTSGSNQYIELSNTGVTSGEYGSAILIPKITIDNFGRILSATNVPISASGIGTVTAVTVGSSTLSGGGTVTTSGVISIGLSAIGTSGISTKTVYDQYGRVISGGNLIASDIPSGIDATKIGNGNINNTEFGYLDSISANIQTQINNKANKSVVIATSGGLEGGGDLSTNRTISIANVGTSGTYTKVKTNTKGQVISGGSLEVSDIPSLPAVKVSPFKYLQMVQSQTWIIEHNLDRYPNVAICLTTSGFNGMRVEPRISYPSENTMILSFSAPYTGSAHLI